VRSIVVVMGCLMEGVRVRGWTASALLRRDGVVWCA